MAKLTVLGCGDAFASGGRHTTSFLIERGAEAFLLDCGASTLVRLNQLNYPLEKIKAIFVTHFHGDHYGGLPFLFIANKYQSDGKIPWDIYGPPGIKEHVRALQEALYPGTGVLVDELPLYFHEFGKDFQWQDVEISTATVTHAPLSKPHGIRLTWNQKSLVFSGDTEWDDHLITLTKGAELFLTECFTCETDLPGHLSLKKIIEKQALIGAKTILLSHMSNEMLQLENCPFQRLEDGQTINLW